MKFFSLLFAFIPFFIQAQEWEDVVIQSTKVSDKIYYLEGRGGNIGVLLGKDGVLLVDDQFAQLSGKIKSKIKELGNVSVSHVINTHFHGDHTGGNETFKNEGAIIVGHQNVRERLAQTFENKALKRKVEAKEESFWPDVTFQSDSSMKLYGEQIALIYLPYAHTDGDAIVYFKTSNVIHTGDAFVRYGYPFIDVSAGGTIDGFIDAQERILALADENTVIIPGHGKSSSRQDVQELLGMLKDTKNIVAKAKNEGVALEDLIPQEPLKDFHERWSGNFINSDLFVQLIYESL